MSMFPSMPYREFASYYMPIGCKWARFPTLRRRLILCHRPPSSKTKSLARTAGYSTLSRRPIMPPFVMPTFAPISFPICGCTHALPSPGQFRPSISSSRRSSVTVTQHPGQKCPRKGSCPSRMVHRLHWHLSQASRHRGRVSEAARVTWAIISSVRWHCALSPTVAPAWLVLR